jgi:hypothetical protein
MNGKNEKLMEEVRRIDPLAQGGPHDETPPDGALLQSILASDPGPPARRMRPRWRVLAPAVAGAAAALLLVVALLGGSGEEGDSLGPLREVALAAASQSPPATTPETYSKRRMISLDTAIAGGEAWSTYKSELREEWRSQTEPGKLRVVTAAPRFVGPGDREAWEAAGEPAFSVAHTEETMERELPPGFDPGDGIASLPLDPDALYSVLSRRADQAENSVPKQVGVLLLIGELLENPAAGPDLRAALYRSAERIPGVEFFGETQDQLGRPGVAIGLESDYSGGPTRYELIWDPETSEVLATTEIALQPVEYADASAPFPLVSTLFIDSRP